MTQRSETKTYDAVGCGVLAVCVVYVAVVVKVIVFFSDDNDAKSHAALEAPSIR